MSVHTRNLPQVAGISLSNVQLKCHGSEDWLWAGSCSVSAAAVVRHHTSSYMKPAQESYYVLNGHINGVIQISTKTPDKKLKYSPGSDAC